MKKPKVLEGDDAMEVGVVISMIKEARKKTRRQGHKQVVFILSLVLPDN